MGVYTFYVKSLFAFTEYFKSKILSLTRHASTLETAALDHFYLQSEAILGHFRLEFRLQEAKILPALLYL